MRARRGEGVCKASRNKGRGGRMWRRRGERGGGLIRRDIVWPSVDRCAWDTRSPSETSCMPTMCPASRIVTKEKSLVELETV